MRQWIADALGLVDANTANLTIWQERDKRVAAEEAANIAVLREHAANYQRDRAKEREADLENYVVRLRKERDAMRAERDAARHDAAEYARERNAETVELTETRQQLAAALRRLARPKSKRAA